MLGRDVLQRAEEAPTGPLGQLESQPACETRLRVSQTASPKRMIRALAELGRISNLPSVFFNLSTGLILTGCFDLSTALCLWLGGAGFYLAGMASNDAADSLWDREHNPARPIPSGRITIRQSLVFTGCCWALGVAAFLIAGVHWVWIIALSSAVFGYNLKHKNWPPSVWIMGLCRALLVPLAASVSPAQSTVWSLHPLFWGGALGLFVVGLSIQARGAFSFPLLLTPAWTGAAVLQHPGAPPFLAWLATVALILLASRRKDGIGWLLAGMILIDAQAWACAGLPYWWAPLAATAILRGFQRWISAN